MKPWIDQAERIATPLAGELPTGEDPRYSDEFSVLKAEIEKKTDVDFELIGELCERILAEKSKDLRVVSYWVMSLSRREGFSGLAKGMTVLSHLVEQFGDSLHPNKPRARQSAIKWFQQEKVLTFAQSATKNVAYEEADFALTLYDTLFKQLSSLCEEPMSWPDLKQWLEKKRHESAPAKSAPNSEAVEVTKANEPTRSTSPASVNALATASSTIESSTQYTQTIRQLMLYFREQKLYAKMVGVALSCQWGNLKMPQNENGKTRLPAPRDASLARIRNAMENEQWEEGMIACMDAFMEPSGQFLIDIPKWLHDCAKNSGQREVADLVMAQVTLLIKRLPKFMQLSFENDESFVSSTAAAWLEQIDQQGQSGASGNEKNSLADYLTMGRTVMEEKNIQEAFKALMLLPQNNDLERSYIAFCKAQLCVEQDRSELALPILLQLEKTVDNLSLANVAPEFAMQVWRQLYRLLKDRSSGEEQEQSKAEMEIHIAHLQSLMCTTDVASAMQWL